MSACGLFIITENIVYNKLPLQQPCHKLTKTKFVFPFWGVENKSMKRLFFNTKFKYLYL